jgi:hypothetical protein
MLFWYVCGGNGKMFLRFNILKKEKYFILNTYSLFGVFDIVLQYYNSCKYTFHLMYVLLNSLHATELSNSALLPGMFLQKCRQFLLGFSHLAHLSLLVLYQTAYIYISFRPRGVWYGKWGSQNLILRREITLWEKKMRHKSGLTAMGIRCADHATLYISKRWH